MKRLLIIMVALMLFGLSISAKMQELKLDPEDIFSGREVFIYGLFDNESGEEITETEVICEVEDGYLLIDDSVNESFVSVKLDDLSPYSGEKSIHYAGDYVIHSQFTETQIIIDAETPDGEQHIELDRPEGLLLHNDQLLFSLRAMDFSIEKQKLKLFIPANASIIDMAVMVEGIETFNAPAGEFEVYRVTLDFGLSMQTAFYEVENPHKMIAYDNGTLQYRLKESKSE